LIWRSQRGLANFFGKSQSPSKRVKKPFYSFSGSIPLGLLRLMDAHQSTKRRRMHKTQKSAGITKKVIPECFNRESRKTD